MCKGCVKHFWPAGVSKVWRGCGELAARVWQACGKRLARVWRGCGDSIEGYLSSAKIYTAEVSRDRCESDGAVSPDHILKMNVLR